MNKRRQLTIYLLCQLGRIGRVMNLKGEELSSVSWRPHQLNLDVAPHLIDWILGLEKTAEPGRRCIKLKAVYDPLQAGMAQNLLRGALQSVLEIHIDVLHDVLVGHFLLFRGDQRIGLIGGRQKPAHSPYRQPGQKQGKHDPPAPSHYNGRDTLPSRVELARLVCQTLLASLWTSCFAYANFSSTE